MDNPQNKDNENLPFYICFCIKSMVKPESAFKLIIWSDIIVMLATTLYNILCVILIPAIKWDRRFGLKFIGGIVWSVWWVFVISGFNPKLRQVSNCFDSYCCLRCWRYIFVTYYIFNYIGSIIFLAFILARGVDNTSSSFWFRKNPTTIQLIVLLSIDLFLLIVMIWLISLSNLLKVSVI